MVLSATDSNIYFGASGLISIITIAALGIAMQKKHHKAMGVIALAFVLSFFLPSWIALAVSLGYLIISAIWFKSEKNKVESVDTKSLKKAKKTDDEEDEPKEEDLIKCRFCKKLYSSEYNGCPYCKKK